jgi:hypothetical protein
MKRLLSIAAVCGVMLYGAPSLAAPLRAEFRGTVVQGSDDTGFFGASGLDGLDFTADYLFDPTQGMLTVTPDSVDALGGIEFGAPSPILAASLTINGKTAAFSTDQFNGEVRYDAGGGIIKFAAGEDSAVDNELDLYILDPAAPLSLNSVFEVHGGSPPGLFNYDAFFGGVDDPHFHGVLQATSLRVTSTAAVVPEPLAWALMTTGFLALGCALRRRRRLAHVG